MRKNLFSIAILVALAGLAGGCAQVPQQQAGAPGSRTITLTAAQVAQCDLDGGCAYLSRKKAQEFMEYGYRFGMQETCQRGGGT